MFINRLSIAMVMSAPLFSGCVTPSGGNSPSTTSRGVDTSCPFISQKMLTGTVVGAAAGGVAAALTRGASPVQRALMVVGAAAVGGAIGKRLDRVDCNQARLAMQQMASSPVGTPVTWTNPESGNRGSYIAKTDIAPNATGQLCRAYREIVVLKDGSAAEREGLPCRDADGDWHAA
jgi:surface antigen